MKKNLYVSLAAIMIAFALCLSLTLSTYYYIKVKRTIIAHEQDITNEKIEQLLFALETSDKVIYHFGNSMALRMENNSLALNTLYEQQPSFSKWDFNELSKQYKMDIYIINEHNVIEYSSVRDDIGLDFNSCCSTLAKILDERRNSGQFYHDGLDVEQSTGELKKYSYMSTSDRKYLIQLGIYWKVSGFYNDFEFDHVADQLVDDRIKSIRLFNSSGLSLSAAHSDYVLAPENKHAFKEAIQTITTVELKTKDDHASLSYFYVPYQSTYDLGVTNKKVIEVTYNNMMLNKQLSTLTKHFFIQILFILIVTIILAILIANKISKPIFLAFHDPLTKLGNRTYLHDYAKKQFLKNKSFALIIVDIDNFKMVNDRYGHTSGDKVLKLAARLNDKYIHANGYAFRYGGDEFVAVINTDNKNEVMKLAELISEEFKLGIAPLFPNEQLNLSLSIGIAFSNHYDKHLDDLLNKADKALYMAKNNGKDQIVS